MYRHQTIEYGTIPPARIVQDDAKVDRCRGEPHRQGGMQPPFIEKGSGHALKKGSQERQKMVFLLQRLPAIEQNTVSPAGGTALVAAATLSMPAASSAAPERRENRQAPANKNCAAWVKCHARARNSAKGVS